MTDVLTDDGNSIKRSFEFSERSHPNGRVLRDFKNLGSSFSGGRARWESGFVVLKLIQVWRTATDGTKILVPIAPVIADADFEDEEVSADDPDIPQHLIDRKKAKQHERETALAAERGREERLAEDKRERQEEDEAERERQRWLHSDDYRVAVRELSAEIHDAKDAVSSAIARAAQEQREARAALESLQREALVVSGNRVYFTRDGRHLYGEDQQEITNSVVVTDARRQHEIHPAASAYEDYVARKLADQQAEEKAERLRSVAAQLDQLDQKVQAGNFTPEELAEARRDLCDAVDNLPPDARADYDRLHAVRHEASALAYRAADPAFTAAPALNAEFTRAGLIAPSPLPAQEHPQEPDHRAPAYKAAPDF